MTVKPSPGDDESQAPTEADTSSTPEADTGKKSRGRESTTSATIKDRLARAERKHAAEIERVRTEAVEEFRKEHGITDALLADDSTAYVSSLEKKVKDFEAKELERLERDREDAIAEAIFENKHGSTIHEDKDIRAMVLNYLRPKLEVKDGTVVIADDPDLGMLEFMRNFLEKHPQLVKPIKSGGASSRVDATRATEQRDSSRDSRFGFTKPTEEEARKMWRDFKRSQ